MGALPRLKKKDELHYRKGSTNEIINCRYCDNYISVVVGRDLNERLIMSDPRCKVMGNRESIRYRVRPDYTCDVQTHKGRLRHNERTETK
ncbi:MAG: hypothetical protein LLG40_15590 [Deltaproteobacteria bacterium]|nr:hypothetical protein [Deltaproteobacteria bacterium]